MGGHHRLLSLNQLKRWSKIQNKAREVVKVGWKRNLWAEKLFRCWEENSRAAREEERNPVLSSSNDESHFDSNEFADEELKEDVGDLFKKELQAERLFTQNLQEISSDEQNYGI